MNEFHARVCQAQIKTNAIADAQTQFPNLCAIQEKKSPACVSFLPYARCYYNQKPPPSGMGDYLPLIILAAVLGLFGYNFILFNGLFVNFSSHTIFNFQFFSRFIVVISFVCILLLYLFSFDLSMLLLFMLLL